jgi:ParB family transcriptional regulator, chromosome partitioning protein
MQYEAHPIADIMPALNPEELAKLREALMIDGLAHPIQLFEGKILDGRHRYQLCVELGVEMRFEEYQGSWEQAVKWAWRVNDARRQLTTEQRAAAGVAQKALEAERARERMTAGVNQHSSPVETFPQADIGKARDKAGEAVGVSGKTIDKAEKIAESAPDVFDRMKQGQYGSLETARKVAELPEEEREVVHQAMDEGVKAKEAVKSLVAANSGNGVEGDEWYTPEEYIEAARKVLGSIDLDPASNAAAQEVVKAVSYFTKDDDGLEREWHGRVFVNPPYSYPLIERFVHKLFDEFHQGRVTDAIILVNNCTDTRWFHLLLSKFPACFTRGRVQFWRPGQDRFATRQGQAFFYLGNNPESFCEVFSEHGVVVGVM